MIGAVTEIADRVFCCDLGFVNAYLIGQSDGTWAIVDTGLAAHFDALRHAAATCFGTEARPAAIYLTHGHGDHSGSALSLAAYYDVPIYVHRRELPFVTGKASYPPLDPTVGGAMAFLSRFFPGTLIDLSDWVHPLPDGELPGLARWQVIDVPGHAPGQIAFFRPEGRVLLAGDACTTLNLDRWEYILAGRTTIAIPPAPSTTDWVAARKSAKRLAALQPRVLACGHGKPMADANVSESLFAFSEHFIAPLRGRYVPDPVQFDDNGIVYLPPKPNDPLPKAVAVLGIAAVLGAVWYSGTRPKRSE